MAKHVFRKAATSAVCTSAALLLAAAVFSRPLAAQDVTGRCTLPDSIAVRGNSRIADQKIRTDAGITAGTTLNFPVIQRALKALYALNEFDDVGYSGPEPDEEDGAHRIFFRLYALDTELSQLATGVTRAELRTAAKGHIIATAELVGIA